MYKDYIWENFMSREDSLLVNCLCIRIARNTICTLKAMIIFVCIQANFLNRDLYVEVNL